MNGMVYFSSNTDSLSLLGLSNVVFFSVPGFYTPPVLVMAYPLTYSSSFFPSCHQMQIGGDTISAFDTVVYDGYGKLLLPGVVYDSVVRLHFRSVTFDSEEVFTGTGTDSGSNMSYVDSFAWIVPGIHGAVFGICVTVGPTLFRPYKDTVKQVTISHQYNELGLTVPPSTQFYFSVVPNPAYGSATIDLNLEEKEQISLDIFDALGRNMKNITNGTYSGGNHKIVADLSSIRSGVYLIELKGAGERIVQSIIIQ